MERFISSRRILAVTALFLSGCGSISVIEEKDGGPDRPVNVSHIPEPVPRAEPRTQAGNKSPYKVLGKTYHVMKNPNGFRQKGIASWYGKKFHGRRTSNGEIYDMYGMTAAHKTLPIPSYVRVTNTKNFRSIIVRVNDRGPFHDGRIIDLTYSAAKKLGFEKTGTAPVSIEYIDPNAHTGSDSTSNTVVDTGEPMAPSPGNSAGYALPKNTYLQVGAFSKKDSAQRFQSRISKMTQLKVVVVSPQKREKKLYKVRVGPFADNLQMQRFRQRLIDENFPTPHVVYP